MALPNKEEAMRKFILTMLALGAFTAIMIISKPDPLSLGLGVGFLLSPMAAANAMEHKFNGKPK